MMAYIPRDTWWSGLPAEVLEIVDQVERCEAPDPWRLVLLRASALRAEHGQAPSKPQRDHWEGMMSPADRASVAHDLLSIVHRAEGLIRVRHENTNQNGRTK